MDHDAKHCHGVTYVSGTLDAYLRMKKKMMLKWKRPFPAAA